MSARRKKRLLGLGCVAGVAFLAAQMLIWMAAQRAKSGDAGSAPTELREGLITECGRCCTVGCVLPYAGNEPPEGWLLCDGKPYPKDSYDRLARALKGTPFYEEADKTFRVPDLQGRVVVGSGTGNGLTARPLGEARGEESHILTVDELAQHDHGVTDPGHRHPQLVTANEGTGTANRWDFNSDHPNKMGVYEQGCETGSKDHLPPYQPVGKQVTKLQVPFVECPLPVLEQ